jgi:hypothetical protein
MPSKKAASAYRAVRPEKSPPLAATVFEVFTRRGTRVTFPQPDKQSPGFGDVSAVENRRMLAGIWAFFITPDQWRQRSV